MKRKKPVRESIKSTQPVIEAKVERSVPRPAAKRGKCIICGDEVAPFSEESLCWVCRRLKFSAWKDSENQPSIQE